MIRALLYVKTEQFLHWYNTNLIHKFLPYPISYFKRFSKEFKKYSIVCSVLPSSFWPVEVHGLLQSKLFVAISAMSFSLETRPSTWLPLLKLFLTFSTIFKDILSFTFCNRDVNNSLFRSVHNGHLLILNMGWYWN